MTLGFALASQMSKGSISMFGDSLTTASLGYGGQLASLYPNTIVDNQGVGGQTSPNIACRYGVYALTGTLAGNTIPASGGVTVTGLSNVGVPSPFYHWNYTLGSFACSISGVKGIMSYNNNVVTFTRSAPGASVSVASTVGITVLSTVDQSTISCVGVTPLSTSYGRTLLWMAGRNDIYDNITNSQSYWSLTSVMANTAAAVAACGSSKFLIMFPAVGESGLTTGESTVGTFSTTTQADSFYSTMFQWRTQLAATYPNNFLDFHQIFVTAGQYNSWTPVSTTYQIINQTVCSDGTHPIGSSPQYQLVEAQAVQTFLQTKGWV